MDNSPYDNYRDAPEPLPDTRFRANYFRSRRDRLTAETTARSEAVVMEVAMPTPQLTESPIAHSTYAAACALSPEDMACSE